MMKCPDCGTDRFYVKDPDDQYTISEFTTSGGQIEYLDSDEDERLEVNAESEVFCDRCAWHDKFKTLQK